MNRNMTTKMSQLLLKQLGPRLLSTTSFTHSIIAESSRIPNGTTVGMARVLNMHVRNWSTHASSESGMDKKENTNTKAISSYWGVAPPSLTKADGSAWKWNCFRVSSRPMLILQIKYICVAPH